MKIQLTKEFIMEALEEEDIRVLQPNAWFVDTGAYVEHCPRCAVGSVLVRALSSANEKQMVVHAARSATRSGGSNVPDDHELEDEESLEKAAVRVSQEGYPLSALSLYFEGLCTMRGLDEGMGSFVEMHIVRTRTIEFVQKHFPPTIIVDINGAQPASDVEVVDAS